MNGVRIAGIGKYCPSNVVSNKDIEKIVDTSDEWIFKRTGIKERRISTGEGTVELGVKASEVALKNSGYTVEDIDLIIVATVSPDAVMPSTACSIQSKLGCRNAVAFDISAACSGFIYSMIVANNLLKVGQNTKALIIGTEVLSKIVDWNDRGTCILFGDGAGAVVLEISNENKILSSYFGSDGKGGENALISSRFSMKNPFTKEESFDDKYIKMEGQDVFRFAVSIIPKIVSNVLEEANENIENIKYIVPHQANERIINESARKLKIDKDKFYKNLDRYGNTSSASVPIALSEMSEKGLLNKGDKIILAAFGGGLTWAGVLIEW